MSAELFNSNEKWNHFYFGYLGYDEELAKEANRRLQKLIELAPPGAKGKGWVENIGERFYAKIVIKSTFRTFEASANRNDPKIAVFRALERIEDEIFRWRFGNGSGNFGRRPSFQVSVPIGGT